MVLVEPAGEQDKRCGTDRRDDAVLEQRERENNRERPYQQQHWDEVNSTHGDERTAPPAAFLPSWSKALLLPYREAWLPAVRA